MTKEAIAPKRIFATVNGTSTGFAFNGFVCNPSGMQLIGGWRQHKSYDQRRRETEYIRADLVTAMAEALRNAIAAIDAAYDGPDDNGRYSTRERAALAAWEGRE